VKPLRPLDALTRHDLWIVAAATLLTFALACVFEWHEHLQGAAARFERWQLDELPIALGVLCLGLTWCALRGKRAAVAELRRRVQAEQDGLRLLARNHELAQQLIEVQESERRTLARELHDELGQHCSAIRVEAACMQRARGLPEMAAAAARTAATADALYGSVRSLLRRLRPAELDELGLLAALQALCEAWELRSGTPCLLHHDGSLDGLGEQLDTALYRVTQEALTNVLKHAGATQVKVSLQRRPQGEVILQVSDDGDGFDATQRTSGLGLLGAAERAAALHGALEVDSAPGQGTRVRLKLPVPVPMPAMLPTSAGTGTRLAGERATA